MDVGSPHLQNSHNRCRSLQERTNRHHCLPPITYSFKVLQAIEKRVGAKLVSEMMENVTTPDQYELLEMSKISGFIDRARGTGRPTKKDRRSIEEFTTPEFMDDFDFDFDFEEDNE